jgi:ATP-binding cassette subfamily B protein
MVRPVAHAAIVMAVLGAVGCSVGAQYGVKVLVDTLSGGVYADDNIRNAWLGVVLLATLIAADNLLWRVASWIASLTFVSVRVICAAIYFAITGHAPGCFAERILGR